MRLISQNNLNDVPYEMHTLKIPRETGATPNLMIVAQNITGMEIPMGSYNTIEEAVSVLERVRQANDHHMKYFQFPQQAAIEEKKEETPKKPDFVDKKLAIPEENVQKTGSLEVEIGDKTDEEL